MLPSRKERNFYVYIFIDIKGLPRYVGKGIGDRWKHHYKSKTPFGNYLKNLNHSLIPETIMCKDEDSAFALEKIFIAKYGRLNNKTGTLFNMTDGGEGLAGCYPNAETRKKMGNSRRGRKHSEKTKVLMSELAKGELNHNYGKKLSVDTRNKMSNSKLGFGNWRTGMVGYHIYVPATGKFFTPKGPAGRFCFNKSLMLKQSKYKPLGIEKITSIEVKSTRRFICKCGFSTLSGGNFNRWHGDNCRNTI